MNVDRINTILEEALSALLQAHGFPPFFYRGWLAAREGLPGFRASFDPRDDLHPSVCQVNFEIFTGRDGIITESFAALCETPEGVAEAAVKKFAESTLHAVLAGLCGDRAHAEQVETELWPGDDGSSWRVYIGGWQLVGYDGDPRCPSTSVFESVQALAKHQLQPDREVHWCRVFYSNLGGNRVVEALWNNEPWEAAIRVLETTDWTVASNQTSRCFALFRKEKDGGAG
jgi:hypothetical protein